MGDNPIIIVDPDEGMTSGSCCETDKNGNTNLGAVVIIAHRPGSSRWKNFLNNVKNQAIELGAHITVFGLNALGTHANNNVTFGTVSLPDAEGFGSFEKAARFGRLAGNITSIIQGVGEDVGAALTVGVAVPIAVPLGIHGTTTALAGAEGTAREIVGLVNYFSKRKHNAGKTFRGGNKKSRDGYLTSKPKDFQRWFHRFYKYRGSPNAPKQDIDDAFVEWQALGRPTVK